MIYLSQLIDQKVWDGFGHVVGKIDDIMVNATEKSAPPLSALVLKNAPENMSLIDAQSIASLWPSITLKTDITKLVPYMPKGHCCLNSAFLTRKLWIPKANGWCA